MYQVGIIGDESRYADGVPQSGTSWPNDPSLLARTFGVEPFGDGYSSRVTVTYDTAEPSSFSRPEDWDRYFGAPRFLRVEQGFPVALRESKTFSSTPGNQKLLFTWAIKTMQVKEMRLGLSFTRVLDYALSYAHIQTIKKQINKVHVLGASGPHQEGTNHQYVFDGANIFNREPPNGRTRGKTEVTYNWLADDGTPYRLPTDFSPNVVRVPGPFKENGSPDPGPGEAAFIRPPYHTIIPIPSVTDPFNPFEAPPNDPFIYDPNYPLFVPFRENIVDANGWQTLPGIIDLDGP